MALDLAQVEAFTMAVAPNLDLDGPLRPFPVPRLIDQANALLARVPDGKHNVLIGYATKPGEGPATVGAAYGFKRDDGWSFVIKGDYTRGRGLAGDLELMKAW